MEMKDPEYDSQHAEWQKEHDKVIDEMRFEQELKEKFPHGIKVPSDNNKQWFTRWQWCGEHFECETYGYAAGYFYFKQEEDAVFFALKWSGHD